MPRALKVILAILGGMTALVIGLILVVLITFLIGIITPEATSNQFAVIDISGMISSGSSLSAQASAIEIGEQINRAKDDQNIKGLILRINSPGGSAAASDTIYREIKRYKAATDNPVIATMEDVAASGGYYIATAADEIYANQATTTGSIGVILQFPNMKELYEKIGIKHQVFKSGEYKDTGNPSRDITAEEEEMMQDLIDQIHQQFVDAVVKGRDMEREEIEKIADGRILTGADAAKLDLIDGIATFYESVERLEELTGLEDVGLNYLTRKSFFDIFFAVADEKLDIFNPLTELGFRYQ